jgi:hypothetical protein
MIIPKINRAIYSNYIVENNLEDSELRSMIPLPHPNKQLSTPPVAATAATISPNPMVYEKHRSEKFTPTKIDLIRGNDCVERYPSLSLIFGGKNGFDPTDPSVQKSMEILHTKLTDFFSTEYELKVEDPVSHEPISYVRISKTFSDQSFQNSKEWLDVAIQIAGSKNYGTFEAAYCIVNQLLRFYRDSIIAACETQRVPICKPMSATAFSAMLQAGKISGTGEQELKKYLSSHLGQCFCPTRQSVNMLSEGHGVVHYGCLEFTYDGKEQAETLEWTEKNIDNELTCYLQCHLSSVSVNPSNVVQVQIVTGGNHGDLAFQFGASVSVKLVCNRRIEFKILVCELIYWKDTGSLIEQTILSLLTNGLKIIATIPLQIHIDDNGNINCKFYNNNITEYDATLTIELYITGDLAFQAMALRKESTSGHWCMQCKSHKDKFLDNGEMQTTNVLCKLGEVAEKSKGNPALGAKRKPWWTFIPLTNCIVPLLHCEIGVGNQLLDKLQNITNEYIEMISPTKETI